MSLLPTLSCETRGMIVAAGASESYLQAFIAATLLLFSTGLIGCGRIGFSSTNDSGNSLDDAGELVDAPVDATIDALSTFGPFGTPRLVSELFVATRTQSSPAMRGDGLELFYSSNRSNDGAIWRSTRAAISDIWGPPTLVNELNVVGKADFNPRMSPDGMTMYFCSDRDNGIDVYKTVRIAGTWQTPVKVPEVSSMADPEYSAAPSGDGQWLAIERSLTATTAEILLSQRQGAMWGPLVDLPEINTVGNYNSQPWLSQDARHLVYSADGNLYEATRTSDVSPFVRTALSELNTSEYESDASFTADRRHVMFLRKTNNSIYEFFEASR
jgi:WD40-like Beta Propeller Repeat